MHFNFVLTTNKMTQHDKREKNYIPYSAFLSHPCVT